MLTGYSLYTGYVGLLYKPIKIDLYANDRKKSKDYHRLRVIHTIYNFLGYTKNLLQTEKKTRNCSIKAAQVNNFNPKIILK